MTSSERPSQADTPKGYGNCFFCKYLKNKASSKKCAPCMVGVVENWEPRT